VPADVLMRGFTYSGFERSRKVELAQGGHFREPSDRKTPPFQIGVYVFPHPGQSASIESLVRELLKIIDGGETAMTMHQPRCQAYRQRFGQQPATGGLVGVLSSRAERLADRRINSPWRLNQASLGHVKREKWRQHDKDFSAARLFAVLRFTPKCPK
jgi:hypothetical protein